MKEAVYTILGLLIGLGGGLVIEQVSTSCGYYGFIPLGLGIFGLIFLIIQGFKIENPKIIFGEPEMIPNYEDSKYTWLIPVKNEYLRGWKKSIFHRVKYQYLLHNHRISFHKRHTNNYPKQFQGLNHTQVMFCKLHVFMDFIIR